MLKCNEREIQLNHFPDGALLMKELAPSSGQTVTITWLFENNEELLALFFLTKHLHAKGIKDIILKLPYIPNARQDRVKAPEDIFTLKYFTEIINSLDFSKVIVLDPHSYVSEALIERIEIQTPRKYVERVINELEQKENIVLFFPDEGAMKRYSSLFNKSYAFGIKKRNWTTGQIQGLEVSGQNEFIKGSSVLIIDDICSKGGTFFYSAKALKDLGANNIYLYVSHCENSIFEGELLKTDFIKKIYTTNSIFTKKDEKIEVFCYE